MVYILKRIKDTTNKNTKVSKMLVKFQNKQYKKVQNPIYDFELKGFNVMSDGSKLYITGNKLRDTQIFSIKKIK
jgi:hypothetical protein